MGKATQLRTPDPERLAKQLIEAVTGKGSGQRQLIPLTVLSLAVGMLGAPVDLHQPTWRYLADDPGSWEAMQQMLKLTFSPHDWLIRHLGPLTGWMEQASESDREATRACWKVIAGIDVLATIQQPMVDGDLLGVVYQHLRSKGDRQRSGAFYTPMGVSKVIAAMTDVQEGTSVCDPCCGTGGMMVAAAMVMREKGLRPTLVHWVANDIDALAVALAGVNFAAHGMGSLISLSVGNALAPPKTFDTYEHTRKAG